MGQPQQANLNTKGQDAHTYDAIVVGSGISGGWAAKELCEKGLRTLVLERGRNVEHIRDYTTAFKNPWDFPHHLNNTRQELAEDPVQGQAYDEATKQFFVRDREHPYIQETPFNWIRGYQVGGRSLTWGRQCYRLSDLDFGANAKDGHGVDWPVRYKDIAPWYDYVESFAGISGRNEGLAQLPDGQLLPPMDMNCIETDFSAKVARLFPGRVVTIGRVANLSQEWKGRGPCPYRNLCARGCPFTGYFSSNGATLPAAMATGNMTLVPDAIVVEVLYDEGTRRARGVRVMNSHTKEVTEFFARILFLNASTIATAALLLQSVSRSFPDGLGNTSGQVGRNLMDHFTGTGAYGDFDGFPDQYYSGRRPVGIYIPRFQNLGEYARDAAMNKVPNGFVRGYGFQAAGSRLEWPELGNTDGFGPAFKAQLTKPGPWHLWMGVWGETLPYPDNRVTLSDQKDAWGLPIVKIHYEYHDNEHAMRKDAEERAVEMLAAAGFHNIHSYGHLAPGGSAVHEMGTARMGKDPHTSVLNAFNQLHDVPNVFITDGSCMTSSAWQNPSLTYMALTARACDYAVGELKKNHL
jgi:choline dehydrogenase-like flavoprotein